MIGLLGKKVGMTQLFDKDGRAIAVTVLRVGPCCVTQIRTETKDGYTAVQLGFEPAKAKHLNKAKVGHLIKSGNTLLRFIREIRTKEIENLEVGSELRVNNFEEGDVVDIVGVTIGKGFQGVVKRHGHKGGEKAHGTKMGREPGSIGSSAFPSRVIKGLKLPGQMGNVQQTTQNLKVMKIDADNDLLLVEGSVPGHDGTYLIIRNALKKGKPKKWKVVKSVSAAARASVSPDEASGSASEASM